MENGKYQSMVDELIAGGVEISEAFDQTYQAIVRDIEDTDDRNEAWWALLDDGTEAVATLAMDGDDARDEPGTLYVAVGQAEIWTGRDWKDLQGMEVWWTSPDVYVVDVSGGDGVGRLSFTEKELLAFAEKLGPETLAAARKATETLETTKIYPA